MPSNLNIPTNLVKILAELITQYTPTKIALKPDYEDERHEEMGFPFRYGIECHFDQIIDFSVPLERLEQDQNILTDNTDGKTVYTLTFHYFPEIKKD